MINAMWINSWGAMAAAATVASREKWGGGMVVEATAQPWVGVNLGLELDLKTPVEQHNCNRNRKHQSA